MLYNKVNVKGGYTVHQTSSCLSPLSQFQHTAIPWSPHIRYLGLVLESKLLFTKHFRTVTCKATGAFLQLFPLLGRDSTLSIPNKSLCTNYLFVLLSHTLPLFGAIHHRTVIADYKFQSPNVSASLATYPDPPPYCVFIPP